MLSFLPLILLSLTEAVCDEAFGTGKLTVKCFGSFAYDCYLSNSDLDLNLWSRDAALPDCFQRLKAAMSRRTPPIDLSLVLTSRIPVAKCSLVCQPTTPGGSEDQPTLPEAIAVDLVHQCGEASDWSHSEQITQWMQRHFSR